MFYYSLQSRNHCSVKKEKRKEGMVAGREEERKEKKKKYFLKKETIVHKILVSFMIVPDPDSEVRH